MANTVLGIDVGCRNIGIALIKQGKTPSILNTAFVPTPPGSVVNGEIKDIMALAGIIKSVISQKRLKAKKLALCISSSQSGLREFTLPVLKNKEIYQAIELDLSKTFKGIEKTHNISYKIYNKTKENIRGIVTFCPKKIVEEYIKLGYEIGIPLKYIDINANCIAKTYGNFMKNSQSRENVLVVDIGSNISQVNVLMGGKLLISRNVPAGGSSVDKLVSQKLDISIEQAEKDKINKYDGYLKKGYYPDEFIMEGYQAIRQEIGHTLNYFSKNSNNAPISIIYLVGGGSLVPNIAEQFSETFKIPTYVVRPTDNHSSYINEFASLMSAIGAAVREV